jgi:septation ring formation regulator EzrA
MKHQRHFGSSSAALRETVQIRTLMSDLDRIIRLLNCDIATEEEHARTFDRSDPAYSMLARTLSARRDNLKDTIAALEQRLARFEEPVFELT